MIQDDYWLNFVIEKQPDESWQHSTRPISNITELVSSWYHHRSTILNGRIADYIGAAVMRIGGKSLFNILNTTAFIIYLLVFCKLCFNKISPVGILALIASSFFLLPSMQGTVFWLTGACNYFWGGIFFGVFLLSIKQLIQKQCNRYIAIP